LSQPYVGEVRLFCGTFAPAGWQDCNGALLLISENETLFNLIGTTYGGDGQSTFAVPNLSGRVPMHQGSGGGGSYTIGELGGVETVTLTTNQIPAHTHTPFATTTGQVNGPAGAILATAQSAQTGVTLYSTTTATTANLHPSSMMPTGGSQPHDNVHPYLVIRYIISLFGIFPSQN
jgi:microcystin-dependent protein